MKIDEQSYRAAGEFEVRHYGCHVYGFETFDRFQLNNDNVVHQEIEPVAAIHFNLMILERYRFLALDTQAALHQLPREARFITRFEQSWPKFPMNIDRRTYYVPRHQIDVHSGCSECSVVSDPFESSRAMARGYMPRCVRLMSRGAN